MGMSWRAFFVSLSQGASELTAISAREGKTSEIHKRRARFGEPTTRGERQYFRALLAWRVPRVSRPLSHLRNLRAWYSPFNLKVTVR